MKKLFCLIFAIILLVSCGKKEDVVTVHFWAFGGNNTMMKWGKERIALFNQTHSDIKATYNQKSWNLIRELLYTNFSTGKGPDVMQTHASYAYEFGGGGHFYPINQFPDFEEVKSWYVPFILESTRYQDNYYGLPGTAIAFVLVCNKELFDKEGLTPPKTWSEFRDVAKKLTKDLDGDGAIDQWGLVLMGGDRGGFAYRLAPFMFNNANCLGDGGFDGCFRARAGILVFSSAEITKSRSVSGCPCQIRWYRSTTMPAFSAKFGSRGKIQERNRQGRMASRSRIRQTLLRLM